MKKFPHEWKESKLGHGGSQCIHCYATASELNVIGDMNHCADRADKYVEQQPVSNEEKWDHRFMDMAKLVSTWSKDPSTKVGSVIVRPDRSVVSLGFNGFPMKCGDSPDVYGNREEKLKRVLHAEVNAILLARTDVTGYTMYVYPPAVGPSCNRCAVAIIQSGISRVIHYKKQDNDFNSRWSEPCLLGLSLFEEAGVKVVSYSE